ncbi:hypothetical protein PVAP13_6NG269196 [Panicum virgatum]|uniref:Uncharacterized protein n=1 Tax=Panicum virgatum TaxID=38727 RepID=A0A8T0R3L1_PANVG|nr:hypothetical protein PVAP13_6NG269196 [Panicum virgatum]
MFAVQSHERLRREVDEVVHITSHRTGTCTSRPAAHAHAHRTAPHRPSGRPAAPRRAAPRLASPRLASPRLGLGHGPARPGEASERACVVHRPPLTGFTSGVHESRPPLGVRAVPPELWEPLGSAPSRALPTPVLELAHRPDDAGGAGPRRARRREKGMAAWPRGARGRRRARRRREEDRGRRSSASPPRSLRGAEPRRARPRPLLLRYGAVGGEKAWGGRGRRCQGWGPAHRAGRPLPPRRPPTPPRADPAG